MKYLQRNPTVRLWCLSGLTGMVLVAGVIFEEGQARVYSPSSVSVSVKSHTLITQTPASHPIKTGKASTLRSAWKQPSKASEAHDPGNDKKLEKKRMGLAMLFMGLLAEEG
jgi:hypothetical protein